MSEYTTLDLEERFRILLIKSVLFDVHRTITGSFVASAIVHGIDYYLVGQYNTVFLRVARLEINSLADSSLLKV